jgi:hypothetical protein
MKTGIMIAALVGLTALSGWLFYDGTRLRKELNEERGAAGKIRSEAQQQARQQIAVAEKQLAETKQELVRLNNEMHFPIQIACKKGTTGYSVQLLNTSNGTLPVTVTLSNAKVGNKARSFRVDLNPGFSREVSQLEGWATVSGDSMQVECPGYLPVTRALN